MRPLVLVQRPKKRLRIRIAPIKPFTENYSGIESLPNDNASYLDETDETCDSPSLCEFDNALTIESRNLSQKVLYSSCSSGQEKSKSAVSRPVMLRLNVMKANTPARI